MQYQSISIKDRIFLPYNSIVICPKEGRSVLSIIDASRCNRSWPQSGKSWTMIGVRDGDRSSVS